MTYKETLTKKGSALSDLLTGGGLSLASHALPRRLKTGIGIAGLSGSLAGMAQSPATEEEIQEMNKNPYLGFIPGVANYRFARRRKALGNPNKPTHQWSEAIGKLTAPALLATTGAAIGAGLDWLDWRKNKKGPFQLKDNTILGALSGLGVAGAAHVLGFLIGVLRQSRTKQEQQAYENSGAATAANYLVPGYAGYQTGRNLRRIFHVDSELQAKTPKEKKVTKASPGFMEIMKNTKNITPGFKEVVGKIVPAT